MTLLATVTTLTGLRAQADALISQLQSAGIVLKPSSRLYEYRRDLAKAVPSKTPPTEDQMKRWHRLLIEVADLLLIVNQLPKTPTVLGWEDLVREALGGSFLRSDDRSKPRARNIQFELVLAASLRSAGYEVELAEPDVLVDTSVGRVAIAAKRPSSVSNLGHVISDAGQQIEKLGYPGLVAVDATILINPPDDQLTTSDFANTEMMVAEHAINVAKDLAVRIHARFGTAQVFGLIVRVCVPAWEAHIPRMSYIERWPVVALVDEQDARFHCCRELASRLSQVGVAG